MHYLLNSIANNIAKYYPTLPTHKTVTVLHIVRSRPRLFIYWRLEQIFLSKSWYWIISFMFHITVPLSHFAMFTHYLWFTCRQKINSCDQKRVIWYCFMLWRYVFMFNDLIVQQCSIKSEISRKVVSSLGTPSHVSIAHF